MQAVRFGWAVGIQGANPALNNWVADHMRAAVRQHAGLQTPITIQDALGNRTAVVSPQYNQLLVAADQVMLEADADTALGPGDAARIKAALNQFKQDVVKPALNITV